MKHRSYPRIQQPCRKTWDSLSGDAKSRFCSDCQHQVHHLDELSAEEVSRIVRAPGRKCVAYREQSEVAKIPPRWWKIFDRFRFLRPVLAGVALLAGLFSSGCATAHREEVKSCPVKTDGKAVKPPEEDDGKSFVTVGIILEDRPLWKRILHIW